MAAHRAWKKGLVGGAATVVSMIAFQSVTASARAAQGRATGSAIASSKTTRRKTWMRFTRLLLSLGLLSMKGHRSRAQTERRGGAGPAGACLAVRTPPATLL